MAKLKLYKLTDMSYSNSLPPYVATIEDGQGALRVARPCQHLAEARFVKQHGFFVAPYHVRYARDWLDLTGHFKRHYEALPKQKEPANALG